MTEYGDFIDNTLKPAIYNSLSRVFPEMQFRQVRNGWESSLSLFGREPHSPRHDKSIVSKRMPYRILEQGGDSIELIEYYMQSNHLASREEAIKALCNLLGLTPPPMEESPKYKAYRERQDKLSKLVETMQQELFTRKEAEAALKYLTGTGYSNGQKERGYSEELIKGMGLGWCSPETASALREICREGSVPTSANFVAIPYISSGKVKGIIFRNTTDKGAKYLDAFVSKDATKRYSLFGLTALPLTGRGEHDKEIVVVEGELDALRAQYAGLENVVGAAGQNLSQEALAEAKRMGVERVIFLLDYDKYPTEEKQREEEAKKTAKIKAALANIRALGLTGIVAAFPQDGEKVDTDSYLATHSIEELKGLIYGDGAVLGCLWELIQIAYPYSQDAGKQSLTPLEIDTLRREVAAFFFGNLLRWERDFIISNKYISQLTLGTITEEAVKEELYNIEVAQKERAQTEAASALLKEAQEMLSKGDTASALTTLRERAKEVQELTQEAAYNTYMELPTPESILAGLRSKKGGIKTGYYFESAKGRVEEWEIPTGALTYICAPTSHGKSRLLQNLALSFAKNSREGSVIYISLEEDADAVVERLINIQANIQLNRKQYNNSRTLRQLYGEGKDFVAKDAKPTLDAAYSKVESLLTTGRLRLLSRKENRDIGYIEELSGFIKYANRMERVQAVFIDYVQELYSKSSKGKSRKEELMDICNTLMEISVGTGLPIVLAAQLNREAASPLDMSVQNIADASNIEHSANCVLLLWDSVVLPVAGRDNSYYFYTTTGQGLDKTKQRKTTEDAQALEDRGFTMGSAGTLYAILAKNRLGERNIDAVLRYDGNTGKVVENTEKKPKEEQPQQEELSFTDGNIL